MFGYLDANTGQNIFNNNRKIILMTHSHQSPKNKDFTVWNPGKGIVSVLTGVWSCMKAGRTGCKAGMLNT